MKTLDIYSPYISSDTVPVLLEGCHSRPPVGDPEGHSVLLSLTLGVPEDVIIYTLIIFKQGHKMIKSSPALGQH